MGFHIDCQSYQVLMTSAKRQTRTDNNWKINKWILKGWPVVIATRYVVILLKCGCKLCIVLTIPRILFWDWCLSHCLTQLSSVWLNFRCNRVNHYQNQYPRSRYFLYFSTVLANMIAVEGLFVNESSEWITTKISIQKYFSTVLANSNMIAVERLFL